jgi:hypothetical protein
MKNNKENIQHSQHGESLKSRIIRPVTVVLSILIKNQWGEKVLTYYLLCPLPSLHHTQYMLHSVS